MSAPDNLINTNGMCRACRGKVENIPSMRGTSLAKLADRHAESCPGLHRGAKLADKS